MNCYINCITPDKIMRAKKGSEELLNYIELVNPQMYENQIFYDVLIALPEDYSIGCKYRGKDEHIIIKLSKLGDIELNVKDYRDITLL